MTSALRYPTGAAPPTSATTPTIAMPPRPDYAAGKWAAAFTPRAPKERHYWLVKSEPDVFSLDDLSLEG